MIDGNTSSIINHTSSLIHHKSSLFLTVLSRLRLGVHFRFVVQESITLKSVLAWMDTGAPFSIGFVTDDEKHNTGGEWISIEEARKHEFMTREERSKLAKAQPKSTGLLRNPHHYENSTRNLILPNGEIRKVAIRLIRRFNGKAVS